MVNAFKQLHTKSDEGLVLKFHAKGLAEFQDDVVVLVENNFIAVVHIKFHHSVCSDVVAILYVVH